VNGGNGPGPEPSYSLLQDLSWDLLNPLASTPSFLFLIHLKYSCQSNLSKTLTENPFDQNPQHILSYMETNNAATLMSQVLQNLLFFGANWYFLFCFILWSSWPTHGFASHAWVLPVSANGTVSAHSMVLSCFLVPHFFFLNIILLAYNSCTWWIHCSTTFLLLGGQGQGQIHLLCLGIGCPH
jgi:hypothetical protein